MYRSGEDKSAETLFATYVPVSMVKDILDEKSLLSAGYADLWAKKFIKKKLVKQFIS